MFEARKAGASSAARFEFSPFLNFEFPSDFGFRAFCLLLAVASVGCTTQVIPPKNPADPATVYLTDYGRHSSLLLPSANGGFDEYAFGDWNYWVIQRTPGWWHAMRALISSPQATLGWRHVPAAESDAEMKDVLGCERLMELRVPGARARALSDTLAARLKTSPTTMPVFSSYSDLYHVKDDEHYWGCHNCNHVTKRWLKELGCDVRGAGIFSSFILKGNSLCVQTYLK